MDKVELPEYEATPIEETAPGVSGLKVAFVNVYGISHSDGSWTLIDTALPFSAKRVRDWANKQYGRSPNAIVLTHGHFDHAGGAKELAEQWDVPVFAHIREVPYLTGQQSYPAPNWAAGGGVMPLLSPALPRDPIDLGSRLSVLPGEGSRAEPAALPGWTILETPGHTPGHISLFREHDQTLIVGDAFCTTPAESFFAANFTQPAELHGPPSYFTSDWQAAKASVEKLAQLNPARVAPGHGRPLSGHEVASALRTLAQNFERIAVPDNSK